MKIALAVVIAFLAALGPGLWITAINVKYRDFRFVIPFIVQIGLFVSPVGFSSSVIPDNWRLLYSLNPMVGVVEGFRWSLLGTGSGPGGILTASTLVACALLVSGMFYFRRMEQTFADTV